MAEKLQEYRSKRDFTVTAEPSGGKAARQSRLYVMHHHAASHDHFDLRLEQNGVLRSWALPKGASLEPGEKRLAVEVEDHPLEYGRFEGTIPKGQYGGGTVMLWDAGRWQCTGKNTDDRLDFALSGEKLKGTWTLVRTHGMSQSRGRGADGKSRHWLLIKRSDEHPHALNTEDRSVASGRTMEEIAAADESEHSATRSATPPAIPDLKRVPGAQRTDFPERRKPQLAFAVEHAPRGDNWLHEIKYDGYRVLAFVNQGRVHLLTRNGKDWTHRFQALANELERAPFEQAIIDGEVVALTEDGSTSFRRLQEMLSKGRARRQGTLGYKVFDLLYLNGYDLKASPLRERKQLLHTVVENLAAGGIESVQYSDHITGRGPEFYKHVCELGLEGMISKRADSAYHEARSKTWLKTKCVVQEEFVVGGYSAPPGSRAGFGSLLLGSYDKQDRLIYMGRVGSGFSGSQIDQIHGALHALGKKSSPFHNPVPVFKGLHWVEPQLVVEVEFTERTGSGYLRHPVFRGLRDDREPREIRFESKPKLEASVDNELQAPPRAQRQSTEPVKLAGVALTNPQRVMYQEQGLTKLDLARFYCDIEPWLLPQVMERPLSLLRCPEGRHTECFFQKHPRSSQFKSLSRIEIKEDKGSVSHYCYVRTIQDLVSLVQGGVLEIHPWGSRIQDVEHPDLLIFDLDPGPGVKWQYLVETAKQLRERLTQMNLTGFAKLTGGKGLHVVVPVEPTLSWDQAKAFTRAVAEAHAQDDPSRLTSNMSKQKRHGRIFIDYLRNGRGNTAVAAYSTRAREGAPVATPVRWDEVSTGLRADRYRVENMRRRLSALKQDPWQDFDQSRRTVDKALLKKLGLE